MVLCQSAVHSAVEDPSKAEIASEYYSESSRLLRQEMHALGSCQETSPLYATMGALMMCFIETTKGDEKGTTFDYIRCAGFLVTAITSRPGTVQDDLKDFIIEYYIYIATTSAISMSPSSTSALMMSSELESEARRLIDSGYVGQLCGCWLHLLLIIVHIRKLGEQSRDEDCNSGFLAADDFLTFALLHAQIQSFEPSSPFLSDDTVLCGYLFKEATYLYLLTCPSQPQRLGGPMRQTIKSSLDRAFENLRQVPASARINTSLCWPLVVIGSCVTDESLRDELRGRLQIMFLVLGFGNIRSSSLVLEYMWALPESEQGPWTLWQVMRDNDIWISVA
ncbi:hypothetical protein CDV31_009029 [Fusarium ambrosium]|uniref:C6 transcription factor n=1 Tax=Fusarium ambrosium TaxID=131363 RepID=A0A428TX44_9HYPO|nr:hypothetical protein CDV31_009029 [Fusarium ambrosium]